MRTTVRHVNLFGMRTTVRYAQAVRDADSSTDRGQPTQALVLGPTY